MEKGSRECHGTILKPACGLKGGMRPRKEKRSPFKKKGGALSRKKNMYGSHSSRQIWPRDKKSGPEESSDGCGDLLALKAISDGSKIARTC